MLTTKEKIYLRKLAINNDVTKYTIGKNNVDENVIDMLDKALTKKELIRISFLKTSDIEVVPVSDLVHNLCKMLHAEEVQIIGHSAIIYRKNPKLVNSIKILK